MKKILGSSWMVKVNGANSNGLQRETYCRDLFATLVDLNGKSNRIQLVRIDRVASDFALTGRNWDNVHTIVLDNQPDKTPGQHAADAAFKALQLNDPHADSYSHTSPYYQDAVYMLVEAFCAARREGRLDAVVRGFNWLADNEGHRVHRLLLSLKTGRQADVLNGLAVLG